LRGDERSRLGRLAGGRRNVSAQLGSGAVLGGMVWDRQHGVRLHIGPLDRKAFESLLPDGRALPAVMALVQQYLGHEFEWDLVLGHLATEVEPGQLGRRTRLGWTSWIGRPSPDRSGCAGLRLAPEPAMRAWRRRQASAAAARQRQDTPRPAPVQGS
ncbi:MAG: type VI secretion system baseplate subunit TssG, partial [Rubrivivax sp.]